MDATILVNRTHRLPRKAIPQTLVEPEIIFDAPVGDRKRLLAVSWMLYFSNEIKEQFASEVCRKMMVKPVVRIWSK